MVHTAADQLDHMVYGTATNMPGQGDIDCVKALLMDITGSQTPATTNLGGACIYIEFALPLSHRVAGWSRLEDSPKFCVYLYGVFRGSVCY